MEPGSPTQIEHRGCRLAYTVRGEGVPVVFIQGTGVHGGGWQPQVDGLADRCRCLTFDNRGMGRSQPLGERLTIEGMASDVSFLMDTLGWESAHLVGHSLGGLVAQCFALSTPARVRSLSLLCTFARGADVTGMTWAMFWQGLRTYVGTRRMRRHAFLEIVMPAHVLANADRDRLAQQLEPIFGHDLADHPPIVMKQLAAMRAYDATPHLGQLAGLPTTVAIAGHDRIARPELGRAMAAGIPGARLVEFPDAAHGVCIQCAEEVNRVIYERISGAEAQRAGAV